MLESKPQGSPLAELGRPVHLKVTALTLDNFKSFKTRTRIPLQEGFSTVSGPNGSGKSNIIDALQFVMGTASSKGMRAERLTDLICSEGGKPVAKVSLELEGTFRRHDGTLFERKVEITRVVRRQKTGTAAHYEVDGQPTRLVDLHDLLRDLGFPTSGQNIVMQGDVIRVTSMGGVARRQVLDELAGAREFDRRIAHAHEELEAADRCTEDTKLILKELAQRLGQLRKERDQALEFRTLLSRKGSLEEDLVALGVTEAEVKVVQKDQALTGAAKQHKDLTRRHGELDKTAKERQAELSGLEQELAAKGEGERLTAVRAVETIKARLEAVREQGQSAGQERTQLEARLPQLEQAVTKAEASLEALGAQQEELEGELEERESRHQTLVGRTQAVSETLRKQSAAQIEAAQRGQQIRQAADQKRERERELVLRDRQLAEQTSRLESDLSHVNANLGEGATRREDLQARAEAAAKRHREARERAGEAGERRRRLLTQVQSLRSGLEATASKVGRAEQELAAAEARRSQAHIMGGGQALAHLREQRLRGLHGTVADLVKFETRYAQALEAAAGGRLSWVVVDDEHVAKQAIEMLKRSGAGRLSFAPLTKISAPPLERDAPRGQAIVGYALDLVESERRYSEVLRSVFGNTLVVSQLQDALPLIGRYRMVTLDGEILERHGLMTGGAASRSSRLLLAAAKASEEVEERQRALEELRSQYGAARAALRRVEEEYEQASEALSKAQAELAEAEAQAQALAQELSRLEAALGPQGGRIQELEAALAKARAEQVQVTAQLEQLRGELAGEDQLLDQLDGADAASAAFEELTKQARAYEADMRGLEAELGKLRGRYADVQGERRAAEERLEAARRTLAEAKAQLEALAAKVAAAGAQAEGLQSELREKEAALAELSSELMELSRRRDEARAAAQGARDAERQVALEIEALEQRRQELTREAEELRQVAQALRQAAKERGIEVPGPDEAPPDLAESRRKVEKVLAEVETRLNSMGPVNQLAIEQFDECTQRHGELEGKVVALDTEKDAIRTRIVDLEGKKKVAFLDAFALVSEAFNHTFAELARGEGRLRLENPKDPFAGGLIIEARPRGKKLSRLEVMSGGEKTLTALAFIFALQEVNPAPFFVFDEVDAALDGVNTEVLAEAVRRRGADRQYLVISHHRVMLDKSHQTIGVTMRKGWGTQVTGVAMEEEAQVEQVSATAEVV